jgi:predicted GNAT superfamily acetyltransferase
MSITIRPLASVEDALHFQRVERLVWGIADEGLVPTHVIITLAKNGGLVLGAFAEDGPADTGGLIGIALGWLGVASPPGGDAPRLKHCSHMAGVLPEWQRRQVGLRLKLAQRAAVLDQGLTDWMTWTYDPLYRPNGVFNVHRLGATGRTYLRNVYGEMTDDLNAGGPSDRCQVDWWLASERVQRAVARATQPAQPQPGAAAAPAPHAARYVHLRVLPTVPAGGFTRPVESELPLGGEPLALPIPDDIGALRRADPPLALTWRYFVRGVLEEAFAAGYEIVDCLHLAGQGWYYILTPIHSS